MYTYIYIYCLEFIHGNGKVRDAPAGQSQARVEVQGKCHEEHKADEVGKQNDHLPLAPLPPNTLSKPPMIGKLTQPVDHTNP